MHDLNLVSLGVLQTERMVYQLDYIAVGIVNVGIVFAAVLTAAVARIAPPDGRPDAASPGPRMGNAKGVQMRERGLPVVHLHGEMDRGDADRIGGLGTVHLPTADPQL